MFLSFLFKKKKSSIKSGDVVVVKKNYLTNFPFVSRSSLLTVEKILGEKASVVFMNDEGKKILRESIPVVALTKVA